MVGCCRRTLETINPTELAQWIGDRLSDTDARLEVVDVAAADITLDRNELSSMEHELQPPS